jgi:ethanolaminephosphotransferase
MYNTTIFVYLTLTISAAVYARFCTLVINDITNYLGIACFTVRRKDEYGVWRSKGHKDVTPELDEKRVS